MRNLSFIGINFRHAKPTILSPRGYSVLLGGGDYAMVKAGALVAENADGLTVSSCSFSRLDGNAVILYGFVRNLNRGKGMGFMILRKRISYSFVMSTAARAASSMVFAFPVILSLLRVARDDEDVLNSTCCACI